MVNSEELIGATEYLTLYARCAINRCRYNRVRPYLVKVVVSYGMTLFGMCIRKQGA
jgi:hypothetical protein